MCIKLTTEEFKEKARKVHGDKYDYTQVKYKNNRTKVSIICPIHGEFWQTSKGHLHGQGCPKCAGTKYVKSTDWFIKRAKEVHGNKYDYSKSIYKRCNVKVCITCPIHGDFSQTPYNHLKGHGCPKCAKHKRPLTREEFINKANKVHKGKYTYNNVNYINAMTKVSITCPIHGDFEQTPNSHLSGSGCPHCAKEKKSLPMKEFIDKATQIHNGKYSYEKANYTNAHTQILITCPIHGDFWQTPSTHLNGSGCPHCAKENQYYTLEDFTKKANKVHKGKYTYENVLYVNSKTPISITCPIHGDFWQKPSKHLQGHGCPLCVKEKKSLSMKEFIDKANKIHNGKYTYNNVKYKNTYTPISITCPKHGDFLQTPNCHLSGKGCPLCMCKYSTTEEFIERANKVHSGKYNYDNVNYVNNRTPVTIICPIHGEFLQHPKTHLRGCGCPNCGRQFHISENSFYDFLKTFLKENDIIREYTNKEVLGRLRLDFYLPKYRIGLEFQGGQHFKPVKNFGGKVAFQKNCERDKRKFNLCNKHGIKMFYFTYIPLTQIPAGYFAKVYTNEEELKRDMLAYIKEQSQLKQPLKQLSKITSFQPDDIKPMNHIENQLVF